MHVDFAHLWLLYGRCRQPGALSACSTPGWCSLLLGVIGNISTNFRLTTRSFRAQTRNFLPNSIILSLGFGSLTGIFNDSTGICDTDEKSVRTCQNRRRCKSLRFLPSGCQRNASYCPRMMEDPFIFLELRQIRFGMFNNIPGLTNFTTALPTK